MNPLSNIPAGCTEDGFIGTDSRERIIYACTNCARPIREGDRYLDAGGGTVYCEDCLKIMTAEEIVGALDIPLFTAGEYMGE